MTKFRPDEADEADEADRFAGIRNSSRRPLEELWLRPLGTLLAEEANTHDEELPERL
jgi:hypothetical protein